MQQQSGWIRGLFFLYGCYMLLFLMDRLHLSMPFFGLALALPFVFANYGIKVTIVFSFLHTFVFLAIVIHATVSAGAPFARILFQFGRRANMLLTNMYQVIQ